MTQHTDLIDRLRYEPTASQYLSLSDLIASLHEDRKNAADALESTVKNAFEAMPHDIPQRMKDTICEETGWSGSMVSRMYTELRKAFTGEPYKANGDLDAARLEVARLQAARMAYASEFPPDGEGEPDVGSIHQNIREMKAEIERLRKDAERYQFLRDCDLDDMAAKYWPGGQVPTGEEFDAAIDAANRRTP